MAAVKTFWLALWKRPHHMREMLIETELTPNPSTIKFLPGRVVMDTGTRDFASPEEAEASPLAEALFALGDVTGVFFGQSFISVTAAPGVEWASLKPDVLGEPDEVVFGDYAKASAWLAQLTDPRTGAPYGPLRLEREWWETSFGGGRFVGRAKWQSVLWLRCLEY